MQDKLPIGFAAAVGRSPDLTTLLGPVPDLVPNNLTERIRSLTVFAAASQTAGGAKRLGGDQ